MPDELGHHQSVWLASLAASAAARLSSQVVISLDANEFFKGLMAEIFGNISPRHRATMLALFSWRSYIPLENDPANEPDVLRRITHRLATHRKSNSSGLRAN